MVRRPPGGRDNELLIAARKARGLRRAQAARALESWAYEHGHTSFTCSEDKYRTWEYGAIPHAYAWPVLTGFFDLTPNQLGLTGNERCAPSPPTPATSSSVDTMKPWPVMVAASGREASSFTGWMEQVNVGEHTIADLSQQVAAVARAQMSGPPLAVFALARAVSQRAVGLLQEGHQHPRDVRDLYLIAGQAFGLMAWIAGDLGQHEPARAQALTAWVCAERSGHEGLRAWARAAQAKVAYWARDAAQSAEFAQDGLRHRTPDSAPVLLACLSARAFARLGRHAEARAALDVAMRARDQVSGPDLGGPYSFSAANQHYLHATVWLHLGQPAQALDAARQAIAGYDAATPAERFHGPIIMAHLDAAHAHLALGEVDGALAITAEVFGIPAELRLDLFDQRLAALRSRLDQTGARTSAPARELVGRIDQFRAVTQTTDV